MGMLASATFVVLMASAYAAPSKPPTPPPYPPRCRKSDNPLKRGALLLDYYHHQCVQRSGQWTWACCARSLEDCSVMSSEAWSSDNMPVSRTNPCALRNGGKPGRIN